MSFKGFLGLVEIRTKFASVIPFLLGTFYAIYRFKRFEPLNFVILFISMFAFDLVTTALNNYFDFKREIKKRGYNYEVHNTIVRDNMKESTVIAVILGLLITASALGLVLTFRTNPVILAAGMLSFLVGICYSFGPVPISRTPFGELFSGFFMGFVIVFLSVYIHTFDNNVIVLFFDDWVISTRFWIKELFFILLLSVPTMCGIANIMLANNICDAEDDLENRRFTLPVYIGKKNALKLFRALYYTAYIDITALSLLRLIPLPCLMVLLTMIPVNKNIRLFYEKQTKKDTFIVAVKNFVLVCAAEAALFGLSIGIARFVS